MTDAHASSSGAFHHVPVLLERTVELFASVPAGWIVDATLGGGGHTEALLRSRPDCRVLGIDQDDRAIDATSARLAHFGDRLVIRRARFDRIADLVTEVCGVDRYDRSSEHRSSEQGVSGVLFDLGVSSPQLDEADRGFSFRRRGPLDMRMDRRRGATAADLVNDSSAQELAHLLRTYGDERFAGRIATAIVAARPLTYTDELAEVVANAVPAPARRSGHPARRTFQALRIAVNEELVILADALDAAIDLLTPGGRAVTMAYHSGEDRIVKDRFRLAVSGGCECPPALPCVCGAIPKAKFLRRSATKASAAEIQENPRSESVRLRAIEAIARPDAVERVS